MWPIFKWSHDGRFLARMSGSHTLSIYETPSFGLLDKKSIKVAGMKDFSWSPTENILGKSLLLARVYVLTTHQSLVN